MTLKEPSWWYQRNPSALARLLAPLSNLYGRVAVHRMRFARPYTSLIPVICVGNFTAGGVGKTPVTIMLADHARAAGERPGLLTRGYGGSLKGPHLVDVENDTARSTGDEALLLARVAPTIVSRNRPQGARTFERMATPPSLIIMDDGLQNPSLAKQLRVAVVDARRGIGNGEVIPSGPLRAPLDFQLSVIDAIIINAGPVRIDRELDIPPGLITFFRRHGFEGPVLRGGIIARGNLDHLLEKPVVAFAGIGDPNRFYETLRQAGVELAETVSFGDHHFFDAGDAERLLRLAEERDALLVTTEKDHVRLLKFDDQRAELASRTRVLPISMALVEEDMAVLNRLVRRVLHNEDLISDRLWLGDEAAQD